MKNFSLENFDYNIVCEGGQTDTLVSFEAHGNTLTVFITAVNDRPQFVKLNWSFETEDDLYIMGDAWERSYGDICFA